MCSWWSATKIAMFCSTWIYYYYTWLFFTFNFTCEVRLIFGDICTHTHAHHTEQFATSSLQALQIPMQLSWSHWNPIDDIWITFIKGNIGQCAIDTMGKREESPSCCGRLPAFKGNTWHYPSEKDKHIMITTKCWHVGLTVAGSISPSPSLPLSSSHTETLMSCFYDLNVAATACFHQQLMLHVCMSKQGHNIQAKVTCLHLKGIRFHRWN